MEKKKDNCILFIDLCGNNNNNKLPLKQLQQSMTISMDVYRSCYTTLYTWQNKTLHL